MVQPQQYLKMDIASGFQNIVISLQSKAGVHYLFEHWALIFHNVHSLHTEGIGSLVASVAYMHFPCGLLFTCGVELRAVLQCVDVFCVFVWVALCLYWYW